VRSTALLLVTALLLAPLVALKAAADQLQRRK